MTKKKQKYLTPDQIRELAGEVRLDRRAALRLAGEAGVDPRTIDTAYAGKATKTLTRERIVEAAKRLGLPLPPEPKS